ncbi:hypothetical protein GCM10010270_51300 [Streptomyces violaceus]|nr:hypothetical protein GCM10010270_51300 [Streptomyces janthinus]
MGQAYAGLEGPEFGEGEFHHGQVAGFVLGVVDDAFREAGIEGEAGDAGGRALDGAQEPGTAQGRDDLGAVAEDDGSAVGGPDACHRGAEPLREPVVLHWACPFRKCAPPCEVLEGLRQAPASGSAEQAPHRGTRPEPVPGSGASC